MVLFIFGMILAACIALLDITRPRTPAGQNARPGGRQAGGSTRPASMRTFASSMQGDLLPADDSDRYGLTPIYRVPSAAPAPTYILETQAPRGTPTIETGFILPALQTFGTAVALTLAIGVLAWVFGWAVKVVGIAFALSLAAGWFWRLGLADRLLWKLESWTRSDIDGNGQVGRPAASFAVVNPSAARATAGKIVREADDERKADELETFYRQCATLGTSEAKLGISPTPSARGAYCEKRDLLIALGIGAWKDPDRPRLGWSLVLAPDEAAPILKKHLVRTN